MLVITTLGFFSSLAQGNTSVVWFLGVCTFHSLIMFLMGIKYGIGGWAKEDILALIIAIIGIVIWQVTDDPVLGLYAAITADLIGMIPALIKTYKLPNTEYYLTYILDLAAILLTGLAVQNGGFNEYLYPAYLFAVNAVMLIFILRPKFSKFISR